MKFHMGVVAVVAALVISNAAQAVVLYDEDFEIDPTANWTVNSVYYDVPESNVANFFYDYSTAGIPQAPNSPEGSGTRGLNLQANQDFDEDGITVVGPLPPGFSVSPTGQNFTGDYKVTFDWWANYILTSAPESPGSAIGSSQLSMFGVGTSGTFDTYPGKSDGVWFAATLDGGSSADYRAYSQERSASYQFPYLMPEMDIDSEGQPIDSHAVYLAESRNNTAALYATAMPGLASPPAAQTALFPQQTGTTLAGTPAFVWNEVEITKVGTLYTWTVNGVDLITVEGEHFNSEPAGGNILFGHGDINLTSSNDFNRFLLQFTLIDNIVVSTIDPETNTPDFDGSGTVDAADYTIWRDHLGLTGSATQLTGDANGDTNVDTADYDLWKAAFGTSPGSGSLSVVGVPEPGTGFLALLAAAGLICNRRSSR